MKLQAIVSTGLSGTQIDLSLVELVAITEFLVELNKELVVCQKFRRDSTTKVLQQTIRFFERMIPSETSIISVSAAHKGLFEETPKPEEAKPEVTADGLEEADVTTKPEERRGVDYTLDEEERANIQSYQERKEQRAKEFNWESLKETPKQST